MLRRTDDDQVPSEPGLIDWIINARSWEDQRARAAYARPRVGPDRYEPIDLPDTSGLVLGSLVATTTSWHGVPVGTVGRLVARLTGLDDGWVVALAHPRQHVWMPLLHDVRPWTGTGLTWWQEVTLEAIGDPRWALNPRRRPKLWWASIERAMETV